MESQIDVVYITFLTCTIVDKALVRSENAFKFAKYLNYKLTETGINLLSYYKNFNSNNCKKPLNYKQYIHGH